MFLAVAEKGSMTAVCKQTHVHLCLHLRTCIEQLQNIPVVSHSQSPGFTDNIKVQSSCQAQVISDLCFKTALKGVNVMELFGPVQKERGKGCVINSLH